MIRRALFGAVLAGCLVALGACAANTGEEEGFGTWEDALGFDKDNVLSDAEFTDGSSLSASDIQAFLEHTHCGNRSSLADYSENGKTAAQMIADASAKYAINPIEFLARLQIERSLLCKPATTYSIQEALSCGCPDGAPCASQFSGFGKQIDCAGYHFREYLDDIGSKGHTVAGWAPHKTKMSSDPIAVTPANAATAALYTYTPWVYNGGNQLHYQVWNAIAKALKYKNLGLRPEVKPALLAKSGCPDTPAPGGCADDAQCNHGVQRTGYVCANAGPERGTCIDGCHTDADCPQGSTCDQALPHNKCTNAPPAVGSACTSDADCTGGNAGASRVCGNGGTCVVGCHSDSDCGAGADGTMGMCDRGLKTWQCVYRKAIGDPCSKDDDCNGGIGGTQRICDDATKTCDDACRKDWDCDEHSTCDKGSAATGTCKYDPNKQNSACTTPNSCPALVFPSGVKIQTVRDAALEAAYANHTEPGTTAPKCFLDVDDLRDPDTGEKLDYLHVRVAAHFTLHELVDTEVSQGWGRRVLLDPAAVAALEDFRQSAGTPFSPTSGYRSPMHQEATCRSLCGAAWCPGTCAQYSRHMHGDAFDLPMQFYSYKYAKLACDSGFHFAYNEAHTHLHVDMNPKYATCQIQMH